MRKKNTYYAYENYYRNIEQIAPIPFVCLVFIGIVSLMITTQNVIPRLIKIFACTIFMGLPVIVFVASIIHIIFKLISASIEKKIINNGTEIMATFVTYYHSLILIEGKNADVVKIKFKYKDKKNKDYFYTTAQIFTSAEAEYFKKLKCTKLKILNGRCTICDPINIDVIKALTCQNPNDTPETIPENTISKETVSKTKKCDFCGCEIDADAKFCNKCGGKQDDIK